MTPVAPLDHEVKFVLPERSAAAAAALLAALLRRDPEHGESVVESIYFDTPDLASWHAKAASDYRKTKVRLRWYDGGGTVWAEVKRRVGSRREKRRAALALDGAALSRDGVAAAALARPAELLAPLEELLPATLRPSAHVRYRRARFVNPTDGARVALDRAIECRGSAPSLRTTSGAAGVARLPWAVVELKGGSRTLSPTLAPLGALGLRRRSFSKYGFLLALALGEADS